MTKSDKIFLAHFALWTALYIDKGNEYHIESFINGYRFGRNSTFKFLEISDAHIKQKYKVDYSNYGWFQKIKKLSKKLSLSPSITFKRIVLEILTDNETIVVEKKILKMLKARVELVIGHIDNNKYPLSDHWEKELWIPLFYINHTSFKQLWSDEEYKVVRLIMIKMKQYLLGGKKNKEQFKQLIVLKNKFKILT